MKNTITDSQLDNATHKLADFLTNIGIALGDNLLHELNDELQSFLSEKCGVDVVKNEVDDSKIRIEKRRQVSCNANEEITYEIDRVEWETALSEHENNEEHALLQLQREMKVQRIEYDSEIQEMNEEFDVEIQEI
jgi:hypothetical protein